MDVIVGVGGFVQVVMVMGVHVRMRVLMSVLVGVGDTVVGVLMGVGVLVGVGVLPIDGRAMLVMHDNHSFTGMTNPQNVSFRLNRSPNL